MRSTMSRCAAIALGCLLLARAAVASENSPESAPEAGCYLLERIFDPALPSGEVELEMARLQAAADHGGPLASYYLGTLYRLGHAHPARRFDRDVDLARQWLLQSALAGNLAAMSGLAELELTEGRPLEAVILAKVRQHYAAEFPKAWMANGGSYSRLLVRRTQNALRAQASDPGEATLQVAVDEFIAEHGERIEGQIEKGEMNLPGISCPTFYDHKRWPLALRGGGAVMGPPMESNPASPAFALLAPLIDAKGKVERVLVVDFSAEPEELRVLRGMMMGYRFNRIPGAPTRSALLPTSLR